MALRDVSLTPTAEEDLTIERIEALIGRVNENYPWYSPLNGTAITGDMTIGEFRQILLAARLYFRLTP